MPTGDDRADELLRHEVVNHLRSQRRIHTLSSFTIVSSFLATVFGSVAAIGGLWDVLSSNGIGWESALSHVALVAFFVACLFLLTRRVSALAVKSDDTLSRVSAQLAHGRPPSSPTRPTSPTRRSIHHLFGEREHMLPKPDDPPVALALDAADLPEGIHAYLELLARNAIEARVLFLGPRSQPLGSRARNEQSTMTSFSALRDLLPVLPPGIEPSTPWPKVGRGGVSFSDDLLLPGGGRLGVRVRITDRDGGGYCIDLRDSDELDASGRFALSRERARTACLLALGHALGETAGRAWTDRIELETAPGTWVDADDRASDPAAIAFGMARTFDAVLGAFGHAWPGRVGAGSCSLGAVVELRAGDSASQGVLLTEVLPGGEGGRPDRNGASAWPGPILASPWDTTPTLEGLTLEGTLRDASGGDGKRRGGDGVIRRYHAHRPLQATLAFDRTRNPPHGIDRAGPPLGTEAWLHRPDADRPRALEPWTPVELPAGSRLELLTCGGAGFGFPGYGDIEWDPSEWFGGKPKTS